MTLSKISPRPGTTSLGGVRFHTDSIRICLFTLLSLAFCGNLVAAGNNQPAVRVPGFASIRSRRTRRKEDEAINEASIVAVAEKALVKTKMPSREAAYHAARETAEKLGGKFYRNRDTGSMEPLFNGNVYVVAVPIDPETVEIGDILVFQWKDGLRVMHRVYQEPAHNRWRTKGDALDLPDEEVIGPSQIVGRVAYSFHFPATKR